MTVERKDNSQSNHLQTVTSANSIPSFVVSLALAIFGSGGLLVGEISSVIYYKACENSGILGQTDFIVDVTDSNLILLSSLLIIAIAVSVFLIALVGFKADSQADRVTLLFPSLTFLSVLIPFILLGMMHTGKLEWANLLYGTLIGGVAAFAQGSIFGYKRSNKSLNSLLSFPNNDENREVLLKYLEMEHGVIQASVTWYTTGTIIFITATAAGWFFSPIGFNPDDPILKIRLLNVALLSLWGVIGLVFGIILVNFKRMQALRNHMKNLLSMASSKPSLKKPLTEWNESGETVGEKK